jgi:hypothetical protein
LDLGSNAQPMKIMQKKKFGVVEEDTTWRGDNDAATVNQEGVEQEQDENTEAVKRGILWMCW